MSMFLGSLVFLCDLYKHNCYNVILFDLYWHALTEYVSFECFCNIVQDIEYAVLQMICV